MTTVLDHLADGLLRKSIDRCQLCESDGDKWLPCLFHMGYVTAMVDVISQINDELRLVNFDG